MTVLTVGHGTADLPALKSLLVGAAVEYVVDVRRFPGSRRDPSVARESLESAEHGLRSAGISYAWEPALGGRRALPKGEPVADTWWTVAAFAAYAAYTRTPEFGAALDRMLASSAGRLTAIMCSEAVWWRCHRRLIADVLVLGRGLPVEHLMHNGARRPHAVADGARLLQGGRVVWDVSASDS